MSKDTGVVKLPALPVVRTGNPAMDNWMRAVSERLEVREGRGNPYERVVLRRELTALGLDETQWRTKTGTAIAGVMVQAPDGSFTRVPLDAFSDEIRKTRLYRDLMKSINDATRFDSVPSEVRELLLRSLADEAQARGAEVQHLKKTLQSETQSLAYAIQEVTAAVDGAAAGVRETTFALATANEATAGKVTQIEARLDGVGGVTIEESMLATANRVDGLAGEYMVKVNAGGAVAGVGLAASEDPLGNTESSFIVQSDKFALVAPINFSQEATPSATAIGQVWYTPSTKVYKRATATGTASWTEFTPTAPFGVNTATGQTYINGSLSINSGGAALQDSTSGAPGQGQVKGIAFIRGSSAATPTGGSFASPTPTTAGWSDGVPADNNTPLWMSTRLFTSDGAAPQQSVWSTPAKVGTPSTGAKVQFSVDGSTSWHDTPTTNDYYMRSGTSTDNGATWAYGGAVKIKGEQGVQGPQGNTGSTGSTGAAGSRGTIVTKITTAWTDTAGYNQIYAIASAAGMTPTYPIKGDIVSYTGGAKECSVAGNPGTWVDVAAYINGNLLVDGTIAASLNFSSAGYFYGSGEGAGGVMNINPNGAGVSCTYTGMFVSNSSTGVRVGVIGRVSSSGSGAGVYGESPITNTSAAGVVGTGFYGVIGKGTGSTSSDNIGVYGSPVREALDGFIYGTGVKGVGGTAASSVGVHAQAGSAGIALKVTGAATFSSTIQCDSNINAAGNVTAYGSSDLRLKKNIKRITSPLEKLERLRGVTFDWRAAYIRDNGGEDGYFVRVKDVGVIAQEVQAVQPEIVGERPDGTLAVRYEKLVPLLIEAVKELSAKVKGLQR